jgi:glutamyl-tRNA synthetase
MDSDKINLELADLLIPVSVPQFSDIEARYPDRILPEDAMVVRVAPSPTGFTHFGLIFTAMIDEHLANQTKGLFVLRIEDTDKSREVENGTAKIIEALHAFDIHFDEGPIENNLEVGNYGPYIQSNRKEIYLSAARELIKAGHAYPCFCTEEHLNEVRTSQEAAKQVTGYYGEHATCRYLTLEQVRHNVSKGIPYALRFKSPENENPSTFKDSIKGKVVLPANIVDYVLIKSEGTSLGLPVYHLAAMVDDHLQKVTHVIRGDEWLPSLPVHLQIIDAFGWTRPQIGHLSPVMKMDGPTTKRKLSKRKDPEAAATYYLEQGIPSQAVKAYVFNIADSRFEDWRKTHQTESLSAYPFSLSHMGSSGALFDMVKFLDICKQEISLMSVDEIYAKVETWAKSYNPDFHKILTADIDYSKNLFAIERSGDKRRKDISSWSEVPDLFGYFYDKKYDELEISPTSEHITNKDTVSDILAAFLTTYHPDDTKDIWLEKMREICTKLGYAGNMKDYKTTPENYKGHLGDVAMIIRIALSGRTQTPDLYEMLQAMGEQRVRERLQKFVK